FYSFLCQTPYSPRSAGCGPDWLYRAPLVARGNGARGAARGGRTVLSGCAPGHRRPHGGHSARSLITTVKPGAGFVSCSLPAADTIDTADYRNTPHGSIAKVLRTPLATAAATEHVLCLSVTRVALRLLLSAPPHCAKSSTGPLVPQQIRLTAPRDRPCGDAHREAALRNQGTMDSPLVRLRKQKAERFLGRAACARWRGERDLLPRHGPGQVSG